MNLYFSVLIFFFFSSNLVLAFIYILFSNISAGLISEQYWVLKGKPFTPTKFTNLHICQLIPFILIASAWLNFILLPLISIPITSAIFTYESHTLNLITIMGTELISNKLFWVVG